MAVIVKNLVPAKFAENVQTTQYTAVNVKAVIDKFTVTNNSASAETLSVNLVVNAGTAAAANLIAAARIINPGETYKFPELVGHSLEAGGFISTLASVGGALTLRVSGREITAN